MTHTAKPLEQKPELKKDEEGQIVREVRCTQCHTWLADEYIYDGRIIWKCPQCRYTWKSIYKHQKEKLNGST